MATAVDPFNQHFIFHRGEDVHILLRLAPIDPTDLPNLWEFGFWLKEDLDDADADAVLDHNDITIEAAANGDIDLDLGAEDTLQTAKTYHFALWRTHDGSNAMLSGGTIQLLKSARKGA